MILMTGAPKPVLAAPLEGETMGRREAELCSSDS